MFVGWSKKVKGRIIKSLWGHNIFKVVIFSIFMVMNFCPKCSSIMIPTIKDGKVVIFCTHCGYYKEGGVKILVETEKIPKKAAVGEGVVSSINEFATYSHKCEKCGYNKAQVVDMGQWYSDEDNVVVLRCGKCGWAEHMERKGG